ncbi:MAG: peptide-binding protein [Mariprofundaceae bacterium]|nr:peptide-binding protein [Mariprofundaceae bacterium]
MHPSFLCFFTFSFIHISTALASEEPTQPRFNPQPGDTLVSASIADASTLIPMLAGDSPSHSISSFLYLPLLEYDRNLNMKNKLSTAWHISDDNLSIRFELRKDISWSDGQAFSSADCAFTLKLIQDPYTQSPYRSDYEKITSFETPDPYTFIVHYKEPYSPALSSWASLAILPKHIFLHEKIMKTSLGRHPKATLGPYFLKKWRAQQQITLQANPHYFDGNIWLSNRIVRVIPDQATQFLELSAGHLDMMGITPHQQDFIVPRRPKLQEDYQIFKSLGFNYTYMGFNLTHPLFKDKKVRQAITYAINRKEIVQGVLLGQGKVIATPYKPGTYWVNQQLKPRSYQPELAKKLLAEAGWKDHDHDGFLDKDGQDFSFTILTNNGNKPRSDTATIIQYRLKKIGIHVKIRLVEWSAFIANFINKRKFEAVILGWSMSPEPDQFSIWHSSQMDERQFNFLSYQNKVVDEALTQATKTFDLKERKQWYDLMQKEIYQDAPMVFLYAPYSLTLIHKRIQGIDSEAAAGISYQSEFWHSNNIQP